MKRATPLELNGLWNRHNAEWRDPAQVASHWQEADAVDPKLFEHTIAGDWWETLAALGITLFVTREYEHLVMAMRVTERGPIVSYLCMPHPSGLVVDRARDIVHVASTRNPNQIFDLMPVSRLLPRLDVRTEPLQGRPLVPLRTRYFPGCLYLHDLALLDGRLYGTAVGQNAIVEIADGVGYRRAWWPRCVVAKSGPIFTKNQIQLNSIAAGPDLNGSYFTASTDRPSARRPGHRNFAVDKRGVIFSGQSRETVVRGLTRPHSARFFNGRIAVDNSGYGELGVAEPGKYEPLLRLPGWTRGLCIYKQLAFVGTSRVIPRFRHYAPGLDVDKSACGIHVVDLERGVVRASLTWPYGNQVFAIDWAPAAMTSGLPFVVGPRQALGRRKKLFYAFENGLRNER